MMMIFDSDKEEGTTAGSYNMIKGKRTKRPRPPSPLALTMVNVAEESSGGDRILFSDNNNNNNNNNIVSGSNSPATSINGFSTSTEEEEDMANCLILLAQGHTHNTPKKLSITEAAPINFIDNNSNNISGRSKTSSFLVNYQCKTCNRCFPSFQALGGHRASHKKPKTAAVGTTTPDVFLNEESKKELAMAVSMMDRHEKYEERFSNGRMSTTLSLQISNSKGGISGNNNNISLKSGNNNNKVHECSICGSEFSSGQALGGHMRRHRAFVNTTAAAATATAATTSLSMGTSGSFDDHQFQTTRQPVAKKPRHILQLDLNLPAPEDHHDRRESKFGFASKEQVIVFSASSLVDCHY